MEANEIWSMVKKGEPCWLWTGQIVLDKPGRDYGYVRLNGKTRRATQIVWELFYEKKFPKGKYALHSCDNPRCVTPWHIRPGTQKENMADCIKRGRFVHNIPKPGTHCRRGHELTKENTYIIRSFNGGRQCKACKKLNNAARFDKKLREMLDKDLIHV